MCAPAGRVCVFASGLCVRIYMDRSEALMHASLCEVRVCVSVSVGVRGWEEAEEGRQRGHCQVSPSSFTSSGELTGTTGNVIIVGMILGLAFFNLFHRHFRTETFIPPYS